MTRKAIKTISNEELKYIPEDMKEYKEDAKEIKDRPLIVYGRKLTNNQKWQMKSYMGKLNKHETYVEGTGEALEYIWLNCVTRVCNVMMEVDGEEVHLDEVKGKDKDALWNSEGMELAIYGAVAFLQGSSELDEEEVKT